MLHLCLGLISRRHFTVTFAAAAQVIMLVCGAGPLAAQSLIPAAATWRYLDTGVNLGTAWHAPEFNDAAWPTGVAPLGYGDAVTTTIGFGPDSNAKYITTYFRHRFNVTSPAAYGSLIVRLRRDDGAVVYLNGTEVLRSNMGQGDVNSATTASSAVDGADETTFFATPIQNLLVTGPNVIAVEVHQANGTSSDLGFDLELMGNVAPTVTITAPAHNAMLSGPIDITLAANASDTDGTVSRVEFFHGSQKLGEDTLAPYSLLLTAMPDGVYSFNARATDNSGGSATSQTNVVTVTDPNPPRLTGASATTNQVVVTFSKRLDPNTATNTSHYQITNTVAILGAVLGSDAKSVTLTTTLLEQGRSYSITVQNVRDLQNNVIAHSSTNFVVQAFTLSNIGSIQANGSVTPVNGGVDINAAGRDVGSSGDDFSFHRQLRTGDFDISVRLESLGLADGYSKAGLMARQALTTNSAFAAVLAMPSLGGVKFQSRATTGANAVDGTGRPLPINSPYTWLRLQRAGNVLSGFGSYDGRTWQRLGSVTLSLGPDLFVGFAVSSHDPARTVLARFRDLREESGGTFVNQIPLPFEPLGPSSRRTGLAISEIMYHPAAAGLNVEFVEIFNGQDYYEDLSGFKLDGDIHFTFPQGTLLQSGEFLVVARDPAAVQSVYGLSGVLGPWRSDTNVTSTATNIVVENLPNGAGVVRLENELGAHLLEVNYESEGRWPAAADGTGHSLVMARPSYGENDPRAWSQSEVIGGSPGRRESFQPEPQRALVINEFLAHTDEPQLDFVELFNASTQSVNISGCWLSDDFGAYKFRIPDGTVLAARGHVSWNQSQLGFNLSSDGEEIILVNSNRTRILDLIRFEGQQNGVSRGRFPDGSPEFATLSAPTAGTTNAAPLLRPIAINEIMFNPISGEDDDEYIELYNRSANPVDIGRWRFVDGVDFEVPPNTIIASGGYLVVARHRDRLLSRYPSLAANPALLIGNYEGQLANSGERLALAMPDQTVTTNGQVIVTNLFYVDVSEVHYGDGGRWGQWSDGGGSSLELIDFWGDPRFASSWSDSDETAKAPWTTIERTGVVDLGMGGANGAPNRLEFFIEGPGEALVDDLEVLSNGGPNRVLNPGFEAGTSTWGFQGTHVRSFVQTGGALNGTRALHLRAVERGDAGPNRIYTGIEQLPTGPANQATLRARVRWLRGDPNFLMRLRGQWLENAAQMTLPTNLGTPGAANSRLINNNGPAIRDVVHTPILPLANEPVVVTARVSDPNGLSSVTLRYRDDPGTTALELAMRDDGTLGDSLAGDGLFSATIPGRATGLVAFYIVALDGMLGVPTLFPHDAPARECLVRFGDPVRPASIATYRLWVTSSNINYWTVRERNSNEGIDATFVYGDGWRVVYNVETLYSGSPWHTLNLPYTGPLGNTSDYEVTFPKDDLLLGSQDFVLNGQNATYSGTFHQDVSAQAETTAYWFGRKLGLGFNHKRHVFVQLNGQPRGMIYFDHQQPNSDIIDQWFPTDTEGRLHKIEDWFEFDDQGNNFSIITATLQNFEIAGQKRTERYRWTWRPRAGTEPNDFADLFALVNAANAPSPEPYTSATLSLVDMQAWMRVLALQHMIGNWDSYGYERGKNMYAYKPEEAPWRLVLWDLDLVLGKDSRGPTDALFNTAGSEPAIARMYNHPPFVREFWSAMSELANVWMDPAVYSPLVEARFAAFRANGIPVDSPDQGTSVGAANGMRGWIAARRAYILSQLPTANFNVTGEGVLQTTNNFVTLLGTAPVTAKSILVNGAAYPITWTGVTTWSMRVAVEPGTQILEVTAVDRFGNTLGSSNTTVNYTGTAPDPASSVLITEIMFDSPVDGTSFVELYNSDPAYTFDLSRWRLDGLNYTFPAGTVLPPRTFLVVADNRYEFAKVHGPAKPIFLEFDGMLDNNGETISLLRPGAQAGEEVVVDQVRYEAQAPWPGSAAGLGGSLQLIDFAQDNARVSNWTDGRQWRFFSFTGIPASNRLLLYLDTPGSVYIDQVMLVPGTTPAVGASAVLNGSFEEPLAPAWKLLGNNGANTMRTTEARLTGDYGLSMVFNPAGSGTQYFYQDLPAFASNTVHTLSFWYLPSPSANNIAMRMSAGFRATINARASAGTGGVFATPGTNNVLSSAIPDYPLVWVNEVATVNTEGFRDAAGEAEPWIELFNSSSNQIHLQDLYLSDNLDALAKWRFPAGAVINPGEFRVIVADGELAESTANQLHTGFRLSAGTRSVTLSRELNGVPQIVDYLTFPALADGRSYGDLPDGQLFDRQQFFFPTPGQPNNGSALPLVVYINEWMASNNGFVRDPADNAADDWFELYNPNAFSVDLGGSYLTDNLANELQFLIPNNGHYILPPLGYLLVWADGEIEQNSTNRADLHVNFQLRAGGEAIGLYASDGRLIDAVTFGAQVDNVSEGRYPAGSETIYTMTVPTPRLANADPTAPDGPDILSIVRTAENQVTFVVASIAGRNYLVEYKTDLQDGSWLPLGGARLANSPTLTVVDTISPNTRRFYRVALLP